jgi:hypothetical protein
MLAVMAARTRMHSRPSRKTRMPMSSTATAGLVLARVGSGEPPVVSPCQVIARSTPKRGEKEEYLVNRPEPIAGAPTEMGGAGG